MSAAVRSRALACLAAGLAGASGMGLETLLLGASGLALGYGASLAIGLAVWISAWALGAGLARDPARTGPRFLGLVGLLLQGLAPASLALVLWAGRDLAGTAPAAILAVAALALPALLQGALLPPLARGFEHVGGLLAANLGGALLGAFAIADRAVGAFGRVPAAWIAGALALGAGFLASAAARERPAAEASPAPRASRSAALTTGRALFLVALGTAWMASLEWVLLRLGVLWLGGMQNALGAVLCASLVALALGAALLPPLLARTRHGLCLALLLSALGTLWPLVAAPVLQASAEGPLFVRALVLCTPALFAFGALLPLVHARTSTGRDAGERLARILPGEVLGALLGIPLVHLYVVPHHGLAGALALGLVCGACALLAVARLLALVPIASAVLVCTARSPVLDSGPYANPAFRVLDLSEDRDFAVGVVEDGVLGERTLLTDGFRAAGTGRDYLYMRALGHLPLLLHPAPRRVAVLALGTGTTVGAVALHEEVERIDVLEISRAVVASAPYFVENNRAALAEGLPGLLDERDGRARVVVRLGDGRASLARERGAYDVITMEPLLPDSPFAVYLYTREFYALSRRALAPGGLVCQWVPPHALEPVTFEAVCRAFAASFAWSGAWVIGTQVVLVGGDRPPILDPHRFPVRATDLGAALAELGLDTPDRLAARWVSAGIAPDPAARALTDADPWIAYRPRRRGLATRLDLPRNLAALARAGGARPFDLTSRPTAENAARAARALHDARVALGYREAEWRGAHDPGSTSADLEGRLDLARGLAPADPDVQRFAEEVRFLDALRTGVALLARGTDRELALAALEPLTTATELRRERADVHLYMAIALARLESPAAAKALDAALARCPGLLRTPEGRTALGLGVPPALDEHIQAASRAR